MAQMRAKDQRRFLFDLYSKNLMFHSDSVGNQFICPICGPVTGRIFGPDAIIGPALTVDLAHIYPDSCGGRAATLTCKKCNNRIGGKFDEQLERERKVHDAFNPSKRAHIKARLKLATGDVGIHLSNNNNVFEMRIIKEHTNPASLKAFEEAAKNSAIDFQTIGINLVMAWFNEKRASVSLWHSAFLMMFREFGYEFAFSDLAEQMRRPLLAEEPPTEPFFQAFSIPTAAFENQSMYRIGIVTSPEEYRCFCAVLPTPDRNSGGRCVLIPGLGEKGDTAYKRIMKNKTNKCRLGTRFFAANPADRLQYRAFRQFMDCGWNNVPHEMMFIFEALMLIWQMSGDSTVVPITVANFSMHYGLPAEVNQGILNDLLHRDWISGNISVEGVVRLTDKGKAKASEIAELPNILRLCRST